LTLFLFPGRQTRSQPGDMMRARTGRFRFLPGSRSARGEETLATPQPTLVRRRPILCLAALPALVSIDTRPLPSVTGLDTLQPEGQTAPWRHANLRFAAARGRACDLEFADAMRVAVPVSRDTRRRALHQQPHDLPGSRLTPSQGLPRLQASAAPKIAQLTEFATVSRVASPRSPF
jgi:hypothetical protein